MILRCWLSALQGKKYIASALQSIRLILVGTCVRSSGLPISSTLLLLCLPFQPRKWEELRWTYHLLRRAAFLPALPPISLGMNLGPSACRPCALPLSSGSSLFSFYGWQRTSWYNELKIIWLGVSNTRPAGHIWSTEALYPNSVIIGLLHTLQIWSKFAHFLFCHLELMNFYMRTKCLFLAIFCLMTLFSA